MDTKLLTYAELAEALGITPASAKRLAIRRGWSKTPGNDGKARVSVPIERLQAPKAATDDIADDDPDDAAGDDPGDVTSDVTGVVPILERHINRLEIEIEALREERQAERVRSQVEVDELKAERDAERARVVQVEALNAVLEAERMRADEAREAGERRLDEVRQAAERRAEDLTAERDRWAAQAERLTVPAPVERRGLFGWLRRA